MKAPSLNFQPDVEVFDANVRVGHFSDEWSEAASVEAMTAALKKAGVGGALVYHAHAMSISSSVGETYLEKMLADDRRLVKQTCFLPTRDDLALLDKLLAQGKLSSARLSYERGTKLPFIPVIYGETLKWLQEKSVPLWIPIQSVDVRDLYNTCSQFPRLTIVVTGTHYVDYLAVAPLMRALPKMHLETSRYEVFGQLEKLVDEFGVERFIYGSSYPDYAMGPVLFYLHRCDFSRTDLEAICGGNAKRLLGIGARS